jgi:alpha-mannosidase
VEFPLNVRSEKATYEIQFGHVERPTHFNTPYDLARFEVSAHHWADLSESGFGVALLNDSKYGYSTHGNVMRLSLLRAPKEPDPQADIGAHTFRYALFPHSGNFQEAKVVSEGYHFNYPIILRKTQDRGKSFSLFKINRPGVVIDTVKKAEDSDDIILRLYESHGGRGPIQITSPLSIRSAWRCDILEENDVLLPMGAEGLDVDIKPFEIVTLKLQVANTQALHQDTTSLPV